MVLCSSLGREQCFSLKPRRPALPAASGPRKQSQREIGTGVVGGCGMVTVSDPRVPVISTGCGGAPRGPGGLPGCPAASLEPAALVSGRPVNKDTGSVSPPPRVLGSPQHRPCLAGTHHILHAQLGSIEQQELRCFVVPVAHSLVECCVPFLWKSRQSLL